MQYYTYGVEPNFVSDLADCDSLHRFMSLQVTQLHNKRMDSVALPLGVKLGENDTVISRVPQTSWPPLKLQKIDSVKFQRVIKILLCTQ